MVLLFGRHYLSNATCLIQASLVLCVFCRVKEYHNVLHSSPHLNKTCGRHVVLDKWFQLRYYELFKISTNIYWLSKIVSNKSPKRCGAPVILAVHTRAANPYEARAEILAWLTWQGWSWQQSRISLHICCILSYPILSYPISDNNILFHNLT